MNIWQTLGIDPTSDQEVIKQAYAACAKQYHPEEHPEEFRNLHDAYRQAIQYARRHASSKPSSEPQPRPKPKGASSSFKPSYQLHDDDENPYRAHLYHSADDEFSKEQFRAFTKENKRSSPAKRKMRFQPPSDAPLPRKLPIRGAARGNEPVGGLDFGSLEQESEDPDPAPADSLAPIPVPIILNAAKPEKIPAARTKDALLAPLMGLWAFYLFSVFQCVPFLCNIILYGLLLTYQHTTGLVRKHWGLTVFAAFIDFFSSISLFILIQMQFSPLSAEMDTIKSLLPIGGCILFMLRFILRGLEIHKNKS